MFWDKKDAKKGLPDLPPMRTPVLPRDNNRFPLPPTKEEFPQEKGETTENMEEINESEEEITDRHNLPSFPDSPMKKGFSQAAIKDAISTEELEESNSSINFKTIESEEWSPIHQESRAKQSIPIFQAEPIKEIIQASYEKSAKGKDIYVKIDKFHSSRRALNEAKNKLEAIDDLLKKIRETKLREEQEISSWEKELMSIKSRIREITENIFDKID